MKKTLPFFVFLTSLVLTAQVDTDSLRNVLEQKQTIDPEYIDLFNDLTISLILTDPVAGIQLANRALDLADSIDYPAGKFEALMNKGTAFWSSGLPDQALTYFYRARSYQEGVDPQELIALNNNIGEVFKEKNLFDSSLFYYKLGLEVEQQSDNKNDLSMLYFNIGELYLMFDEPDSASNYFHESYQSSIEKKNRRAEAYALFGLGEISAKNDFPKTSIRTHVKAMKIREEISDKRGLIQSYQSLGNLFVKLKKMDSGLLFLRKAVLEAKRAGSYELLSTCYHDLANALEIEGKLKLSIKYLHLHHELQDSLNQILFINNSDQMRTALLGDLIKAENDLLKEQQEVLRAQSNSKMVAIAFGAIILIFSILLYFQFTARRVAKKNAKRLKEQNKKLTDSAFMVSHNLREPVTQILGFIELNKTAKDVPQEETWNLMEKSANTIDEVLRELAEQLHSDEGSVRK